MEQTILHPFCSQQKNINKNEIDFFILAIVIFVFAVITLLALKFILTYLHNIVKQQDREKAVFSVWLHNL